eukprot:scaffold4013_cov429-Prasinococcus_capsulatus_cf.AAC.4
MGYSAVDDTGEGDELLADDRSFEASGQACSRRKKQIESLEIEPASAHHTAVHICSPCRTKDDARLRMQQAWLYLMTPRPICNMFACLFALFSMGLLVILVAACDSGSKSDGGVEQDALTWDSFVQASHAAVASDVPQCSIIGKEILQQGGNAVDAAVSVALCLGVMSPASSGIGGGCFMNIALANGTREIIDAREAAPSKAYTHMYDSIPKGSLQGGLAAAIPSELAGLHLAWSRYGQRTWKDLVAPAIALAGGFEVGENLAEQIQGNADLIMKTPELKEVFAKPDGSGVLQHGDTCKRPKLQETLQRVADEGIEPLYGGDLGEALAADVQAAAGILTIEDLKSYQPRIFEPVHARVFGHDLYGVGPPSSGGAAVLMALKLLEKRMVESNTTNLLAPLTSLSLAHQSKLLAEALKHAFSLRMSLGDQMTDDGTLSASQLEMNAKIEDALNAMLSDNFTMQLAPELEAGPLNLDEYGGDFNLIGLPDDSGTTHFSIVDASGSAVGVTSTINTEFGSKVRSPNTGIILNNEMDDFSLPGQSNTYGIPPSEANYIQPFKRPLSSMSPTIVLDSQERIVAVVGGSGASPNVVWGLNSALK